jgi:hypothetical protein
MHIGPLQFKLPCELVRKLILKKSVFVREYKIKVIGFIVGNTSLWFLFFVSHFQYGMLLAALMFSIISIMALGYPWYFARKVSRTHNAVVDGQTWEFTDDNVIVRLGDRTETRSSWDKIVRIDECDGHLLLVTRDGSCSPIPLYLLGDVGIKEIRGMVTKQFADKKLA